MSSGSRRSAACIKCCLVVFAVASALAVSAPALYWKLKKGYTGSKAAAACPPCVCDCPPPISLKSIVPGLLNLSITDCGKNDPELSKEMEKQFADILTEELELQKVVAKEQSQRTNSTLVEAKRLASHYQREAEKCNAATEICEEARERAVAALAKEKKSTAVWELRARRLGWQDT